MTTPALTGQKTSPLPEGSDRGRFIFENATDHHTFYDLKIHVNDDSWDTPEFKKIRVFRLRTDKQGRTRRRQISVVGGDLTESEHANFDSRPVRPGDKIEVRFDLNDKVGEKAHITVTPTDRRGGVIIDGSDQGHEDITVWDKIIELITLIGKIAGFVRGLVPISDTSGPGPTDALIGVIGLRESLQSLKLTKKDSAELAQIDLQLREMSERVLAIVEASCVKHIVRKHC